MRQSDCISNITMHDVNTPVSKSKSRRYIGQFIVIQPARQQFMQVSTLPHTSISTHLEVCLCWKR